MGFLLSLFCDKIISLQKPIFIHLRLDALGQLFHLLAQVGDESGIGRVVALGVHGAFVVGTLEMQTDVVERGCICKC